MKYFLSLILLVILSASCTSLQYRSTDAEITTNFKAFNVPTEMSYFAVDSLDLKVRIQAVRSKNKKYNLVFLHGSPSSLSAWRSYLINPDLLNSTNMYAIDRPGYGYSNFGEQLTSIDTQAQIINAVIRDKKLDNVVLVGTSYGGPLAARIGVLNSEVIAVLMISPAIDPLNEKDIWASRFTQWKLTRWLVPTGYRVAGDEKTVHANELALIEEDWHKLLVPVVHIHGDQDKVVPYENINYSKIHFKNSEIISVPNKGHEIAWENPELIIPEILKLIDQLDGND